MQSLYEDLYSPKAILTIILGLIVSILVELWPDFIRLLKQRLGEQSADSNNLSPTFDGWRKKYFFIVLLATIASTINLIVSVQKNAILAGTALAWQLFVLIFILFIYVLSQFPAITSGLFSRGKYSSVLLIVHSAVLAVFFVRMIQPLIGHFVLSDKFVLPASEGFSFGEQISVAIFLGLNVLVTGNHTFAIARDFGQKYLPLLMLCIFVAFTLFLPAKNPVKKGSVINTFFKKDKLLNSFYDSLQLRN
jgi:hypothetical protein